MKKINRRRKVFYDFMCEFCGHVWTPRVDNPKSCPNCKRKFKMKDRRKK